MKINGKDIAVVRLKNKDEHEETRLKDIIHQGFRLSGKNVLIEFDDIAEIQAMIIIFEDFKKFCTDKKCERYQKGKWEAKKNEHKKV